MANDYYSPSGNPTFLSRARSSQPRNESSLVEQGFDKLPDPAVLAGSGQNYAVDTGAQNAIVAAVNPEITAPYDGMEVVVKALFPPSGASTLLLGAFAIAPITRADGTVIQANDWAANQIITFRYSASTATYQFTPSYSGGVTVLQPITDAQPAFYNAADPTKRVQTDLSNISAGTTRVISFPNANATLVGADTAQTLTNKVLVDASTSIVDDGDATKVAKFQASGITTATTRTFTFPNLSGILQLGSVLANLIPTASANVDALNVFNSEFDQIVIYLDDIAIGSGTSTLNLQFAIGGAVNSSAIYGYVVQVGDPFGTNSVGTAALNAQTSAPIGGNSVATTNTMSGTITINNINSAGKKTGCARFQILTSSGYETTGQPFLTNFVFLNTSVVTGVRLFWAGGQNFAAGGTVRILGVRNI